MSVKRIREAPRITKPFSDESWARLDRLGETVDADLKAALKKYGLVVEAGMCGDYPLYKKAEEN